MDYRSVFGDFFFDRGTGSRYPFQMKNIINKLSVLVFIILIDTTVVQAIEACVNFSGAYTGDCKLTLRGSEMNQSVVIGFIQDGCDKFIFNDFVKPLKFYTLNESTLYTAATSDFEEKSLRRAHVFDGGNTIQLLETLSSTWTGHESKMIVGTETFKRIDDSTLSYESERFDLITGKLALRSVCPSLKRK